MALFLGGSGEDILSWRAVADLVKDLDEVLARERAGMLGGEEVPLLVELRRRLADELSFEKEFASDLSKALAAVDEAEDLLSQLEGFALFARSHFERRRSVVAFHEICSALQRRIICRVLRQAEEWVAQHGFGSPPGRYCWFAVGSAGRGEGTLYSGCDSLLVYDGNQGERNSFFSVFARKAEDLLGQLGLQSRMTPSDFSWQGSMGEWRTRVSEGMAGGGRGDELAVFLELADLHPLCGDAGLAEEMLTLVRGMLSFHLGSLRHVARILSEMPTGLDFFGRLRVEKSGDHRGLFNVEQYAVVPLVSNVRVLAIRCGVTATSTVDRIKGIMENGPVSVELAERLLFGFHELNAHLISLENLHGAHTVFLDPEQLSESEERALRGSLDALVNLQRVVYQTFTEHG
ncbi:putative nucleotidyltransferase substrate binding domain-containing protein [Geobacter sp. DSM 9736]|uniref:putative nucleotidyltransferase substrate binding domain-containing protein n=1 Tax=Geobacter sp. DSM 9736 TaxID=1277350 RepID=UPI000B510971|nr:putative nucleotidyltransferase substrate binding domain-containing protein [Geobacter sp. DSM 9736]SNB48001.1 Putative nucleotidyltransferase DUF294 [Geobacter sp. DSM 9736]